MLDGTFVRVVHLYRVVTAAAQFAYLLIRHVLDFESAAFIRDRIRALTQVQGRQDISLDAIADADVIGAHQAGGHTCVPVFFFRAGQNWGNRAYFPSHDRQMPVVQVRVMRMRMDQALVPVAM